MSLVIDIGVWACLLGGSFFVIVGCVGLLRFPDFFTRMHGAGVVDTLGASLIIAGLVLEAGFTLTSFKLFLFLGFLIFTSPTATHSLAQAALYGGRRPLLETEDEDDVEGA